MGAGCDSLSGGPFLMSNSVISLISEQISADANGWMAASLAPAGVEETGGGIHFTERATDPVPLIGATSAV